MNLYFIITGVPLGVCVNPNLYVESLNFSLKSFF